MQATTALRKIIALKKRIRVIQGGQGAGKTYAILLILINHASSLPDREIFVASAELTKMRVTVIKDFVKIMKSIGLYEENRFLAGTLYRFPNGSFIKFIGLDKEDLGKGLRSDVFFINECDKVSFESFREATGRATHVYLDYNPNAKFWVHKEVLNRPDAERLILTYKDNEMIKPTEVAELESYYTKGYSQDGTIKNEYWANMWRVYGLGLEGQVQGTIFQNWSCGEKWPEHLPVIYGLDWGTTAPTAVVKVSVDVKNKTVHVKQVLYQAGLGINQIAKIIKNNLSKNDLIICDTADARGIIDLKQRGINAVKAFKPKVISRIRALLDWNILVYDSPDIEDELTQYKWLDKRSDTPIDAFNHAIDAFGYAFVFSVRNLYNFGDYD